jgi:sulfhydrogenase subunit alpha
MTREIELDHITKIEGHANLYVKISRGKIKKVELRVVEGARYFEGMLVGRPAADAHYIASRICGVCSQAHVVGALIAVEKALDLKVSKQTWLLRELLLIGDILESHILHLYFLALPDYFGYGSALEFANKDPEVLKTALKLKQAFNKIERVIGGREVHSVTPVVGGFSKLPGQAELDTLLQALKALEKYVLKVPKLFGRLDVPEFERECEHLALTRDKGTLFFGSKLKALRAKREFPIEEYKAHINEYVDKSTTAKEALFLGESYMTSALSRLSIHIGAISEKAKQMIKQSRFSFPNNNPFANNFAQAIEVHEFWLRAIEILNELKLKPEKPRGFKPRAGHGISAVEVPRGILFHEYTLTPSAKIKHSNIITPTSQNLHNIEVDVGQFLPGLLDKYETLIKLELEKLIRAYDPCISCSTHFLSLKLDRE